MSTNIDKLSKRAKRKYISTPVIKHLVALNSPLKNKYVDSLKCCTTVKVVDGKTTSRYCKRTWCAICSPIRTAVRIKKYEGELMKLGPLCMTTLTVPNVKADGIYDAILKFRSVFRQYRNTYEKQHSKVFRGVYNFEITYNFDTGLYHPHIHIIHEFLDKQRKTWSQHSMKKNINGNYVNEYKNELIDYWLSYSPSSSIRAQDTRDCTNLIEGFKYQSLAVYKKDFGGAQKIIIPVVELDIIYQAIEGVRCFQPFGIESLQTKKVVTEKAKRLLSAEKITVVEYDTMIENIETYFDEDKEMENLTSYEIQKPDGEYNWMGNDWKRHETRSIAYTDEYFEGEILLSDFVPAEWQIKRFENLTLNEHYKKRN